MLCAVTAYACTSQYRDANFFKIIDHVCRLNRALDEVEKYKGAMQKAKSSSKVSSICLLKYNSLGGFLYYKPIFEYVDLQYTPLYLIENQNRKNIFCFENLKKLFWKWSSSTDVHVLGNVWGLNILLRNHMYVNSLNTCIK